MAIPRTSQSPMPQWRLPRGVTRGLWQYAQDEQIATDYDDFFAFNSLFGFDEAVLAEEFQQPGLVVDLGCGTGRALLPLVRRGFTGLGVDLSAPMLDVVGQKAALEGLAVDRLLANLTELDCLRSAAADYCLLLFSTLGMIRGHANRARVLAHVERILKPGGLLVVHVHNAWFNLFDDAGRRALGRQIVRTMWSREEELGDKFFDYRGIPNMFLHTFRRAEFTGLLSGAGLRMRRLIPLAVSRDRPLPRAWCLAGLRANGWIAVCEKPREAASRSSSLRGEGRN